VAELVAGELRDITGEVVHQAAKKGAPLAQEVFNQAGSYLGVGIANIINILDPEIVLLGGRVIQAADFLLEPLQETVARKTMAEPPPIIPV